MAKVLRDALRAKFPQAPEKDILKVYIHQQIAALLWSLALTNLEIMYFKS